ncbi:MAG: MarR family transcriptional regulator [Trueperaceae bacterium]|nr:MarR family transcriptional regulator [Trueperaceae bacterium]
MRREESLGYLVNHVARQLARALHAEIAPLGVVPGQFGQLLVLFERDALTQQELSEIVGIEQPTMARTLARMERDGLIDRKPHPTDGRSQTILLTPKARELQPSLVQAAKRVNARATAGFSELEKSMLIELLGAVRANLNEAD